MLYPEKVVEQAQQGPLPVTWRVFQSKGYPGIISIFVGTFAGFIVIMLGTIFVIFTGIARIFQESQSTSSFTSLNVFSSILFSGGIVLILALLLGTIAGTLTYRYFRGAKKRGSLLVVTPEGVVECSRYQQPAQRSFRVLDFADVNSLEPRTHKYTTTDYDPNSLTHTSTNSRTSFWFDVQQRNGEWIQWSVPIHFGQPATVAQYIIEAQAHYASTRH